MWEIEHTRTVRLGRPTSCTVYWRGVMPSRQVLCVGSAFLRIATCTAGDMCPSSPTSCSFLSVPRVAMMRFPETQAGMAPASLKTVSTVCRPSLPSDGNGLCTPPRASPARVCSYLHSWLEADHAFCPSKRVSKSESMRLPLLPLFPHHLSGTCLGQPYSEDRAKAAFRSAAKIHKWAISEP